MLLFYFDCACILQCNSARDTVALLILEPSKIQSVSKGPWILGSESLILPPITSSRSRRPPSAIPKCFSIPTATCRSGRTTGNGVSECRIPSASKINWRTCPKSQVVLLSLAVQLFRVVNPIEILGRTSQAPGLLKFDSSSLHPSTRSQRPL